MTTSINYPNNVLPLPLVANVQHREDTRLLRTTMDSGNRVVRKRFTTVPVNFSFELMLEQDELSYFQAWFAGTLDYGLNYFNMELPVGDGIRSSHEVRFLENPAYSLQGYLYRVNCRVEATQLNLGVNYDSVMLGLIASLGGFDEASSYFDKFDVALNETYPSSGYGPNA